MRQFISPSSEAAIAREATAANSRSKNNNFVFIFKLPFPEHSIETRSQRIGARRTGARTFINIATIPCKRTHCCRSFSSSHQDVVLVPRHSTVGSRSQLRPQSTGRTLHAQSRTR